MMGPEAPPAPARLRRVAFPDDDELVTSFLDPPQPWTHVEEISAEEILIAYENSCLRHNTEPIKCLIVQLKEMGTLGGPSRSGTLNLSGCHLTPASCEALESILKRARFQRIDIHNCSLNDDAAIALFDMIEYYESAAELDISGNKNLGILAWQACSKMINKCQWLEQIEIKETSLGENTAPVLGRSLRPPCSLRSLRLEQSHLSGPPLLCLAGFLKQNKSVRELHLGDNNLVTSDAKHLAYMLKSNSTLQLLDISNNDIQDSGIELIADALAEQSSAQYSSSSSGSSSESPMSSPQSGSSGSIQERGLAVLIVWNNNLTRNSGQHFSKALSRCKSLEVLNIGQNPLCGETINRLKAALQQNRSLLSLGMQSTRLGAEAAIALAEVIEDNPVIQRIDLRDNKLQTAGLLALLKAIKKNQSVTRIDLDDGSPPLTDKDQPLEETRLVVEIRAFCIRNEKQNRNSLLSDDDDSILLHRKRMSTFTTRKISLTCQTLHTPPEPILSPPRATVRLRSPLPSPIPSPIGSPIPSPSHRSRFQVSRVNDSSSGTSQSPSPVTPPGSRPPPHAGSSRFRVVSVTEPPSISVQGPEDALPMIDVSSQTDESKFVKLGNSRFSIVRNVGVAVGNYAMLTRLDPPKNDACVRSPNYSFDDDKSSSPSINTEIKDSSVDTNIKTSKHNIIKKSANESSLDSPDLEVSRLMQNVEKKNNFGSCSSLDISEGSLESLNTLEVNVNPKTIDNLQNVNDLKLEISTDYSIDSEESDVFGSIDEKPPRKRGNLSVSSNESSLDLSAPVDVPQGTIFQFSNQSFLNSSVSSNESVSPNIFGKHMKLHGSVTSLEASVSSLDSFKSGSNALVSPTTFVSDPNRLIDSTDSGIFQSENSPKTLNSSMSSNEGTLTNNSNLSKVAQAMVSPPPPELYGNIIPSDNITNVPKRTSSLLDVPSSESKQRSRKISWVAPSSTCPKKDNDETQSSKTPSSLEKLLNLFQIPSSIFSRNMNDSADKKDSNAGNSRKDIPSSMSNTSFWPWSSGSSSFSKSMFSEKFSGSSENLGSDSEKASVKSAPSVSAEYTVKLADKKNDVMSGSLSDGSPELLSDTSFESEIKFLPTDLLSDSSKKSTGESTDKDHFSLNNLENDDTCKDGSLKDTYSLSKECEVLHCDNLSEIETVRDANVVDLECKSDNIEETIISIGNCDNVNVQSDDGFAETKYTDDVTTLSDNRRENSIIAKDTVQNNLLLSLCDNNLRSEGAISGSQDDECLNIKELDKLKGEETSNLLSFEDAITPSLLCNVEVYGGIRKRDPSICSVTSSVDTTDTDNSPNNMDNCLLGELAQAAFEEYSLDDVVLHDSQQALNDNLVQNVDESNNVTIASIKTDIDQNDNTLNDNPIEREPVQIPDSDESFFDIMDENSKTHISEYLIEENLNKSDWLDSDIYKENVKNNILPFSLLKFDQAKPPTPEIINYVTDKSPPMSSILKQSIGLENKHFPSDRQLSPESGPSIENLPSNIIKRIKENISPENTLTSSMSNTQALAQELSERRKLFSNNTIRDNFELNLGKKNEDFNSAKYKYFDFKDDSLDTRAEIHELSSANVVDSNEGIAKMNIPSIIPNESIFQFKTDIISSNPSIEIVHFDCEYPCLCKDEVIIDDIHNYSDVVVETGMKETGYEGLDSDAHSSTVEEARDVLTLVDLSCDQEAQSRGDDEQLSALKWSDSSIVDLEESRDKDELFDESIQESSTFKPISILKPYNPERVHHSSPKDIPEKSFNFHSSTKSCDSCEKTMPVRCGSLPESISGCNPKNFTENMTSKSKIKSKSPVNTLGKLARDSLYGLNMSEDEMIEINKKISSFERVRSLGSVSEDAGDFPLKRGYSSSESRSLGPFTSQESLASLASISEIAGENDEIDVSKNFEK